MTDKIEVSGAGSGDGWKRTTSKSCIECRRKKIKCDTGRPACAQCVAASSTCGYAHAKRTGLPRGYVRGLEAKINELQRQNSALETRLQGLPAPSIEQHSLSPANFDQSTLIADHQTPYADSDFRVHLQDPFQAATVFLQTQLTFEEQTILSSLFFARCYAFVPIIHETKFRLTDNNVHVKLAMFALASRQDTAFAHVSDTLYGLAKQTTTSTLLSPNMDTLIAMIMLAIYEIGQPSAALNASTTLGSALALVSAFQLVHLDDKQSPSSCQWLSKPKNWIVEEGRRRVVLMVLSLSRWVSTITGREFGLPTRTAVKLSLPVSNAVWVAVEPTRPATQPITELDHCSTLGPFARFVQVQGFFHLVNSLKQSPDACDSAEYEKTVRELHLKIQQFIQSFPWTRDQHVLPGDEHMLDPTILCLAHCACLLLLASPKCGVSVDFQRYASQRFSLHAEEMLDIAHSIQDQPHLGNYMLPDCLLLAGRVRFLDLIKQRGHYKGRDADLLVKCLLSFGKCWGLQDKMLNHITCIQSNTMTFSDPLTKFEPENEISLARQPTAVLVTAANKTQITKPSLQGDPRESLRPLVDDNLAMEDLTMPIFETADDSIFGNLLSWPAPSWDLGREVERMDVQ
ncbi:hypothetical protein NQ176_g1910 [Zarea fungicola]|uniref:Uncharacterized protein n=1 Tax=Zarea fungicola TaxID=93591 RepID=A0ACC1NR90_9HYPO|nr:hypothetical protein NQ176_g1910 [Lecanicillium fungicola]